MPRPARPGARADSRRVVTGGAVLVALALLAGCTWLADPAAQTTHAATASSTRSPDPVAAVLAAPTGPVTSLVPAGPGPEAAASAAVAASRALFASAPVVVLAATDDPAAGLTAASAAVALGAPALVAPPRPETGAPAPTGVEEEVVRLGATAALVVGGARVDVLPPDVAVVRVPAGADATALAAATGLDVGESEPVPDDGVGAAVRALDPAEPTALVRQVPEGGETARATAAAEGAARPTSTQEAAVLPPTLPPVAPDRTTVALAGRGGTSPAVLATLTAAGVDVLDVPGGDPRATSATVEALAEARPDAVLQLTDDLGPPEALARRVASASTGVQLPGGGQLVFPEGDGVPGKRYVALYGTPGTPSLGVLGEQDVPATLARAQQHAAPFRDLTDDVVVPAVEIIATVASAGPGDDGDHSQERSVDDLRPLVDAAREDGAYVVLDLQPGRTDFRTQAQRYADLLDEPHVGLALDPEWRLAPDQVHLRQIGSVSAAEINQTSEWLARFTRERDLPQKMLVLHQFSLRMISDRQDVDTSHDELAVVIHVDGQGTQPAKRGTWDALRTNAPDVHWGWKNFYDEDEPMLDPAQTYQVDPVPDLVTYQ